jgi:hypothetical protein
MRQSLRSGQVRCAPSLGGLLSLRLRPCFSLTNCSETSGVAPECRPMAAMQSVDSLDLPTYRRDREAWRRIERERADAKDKSDCTDRIVTLEHDSTDVVTAVWWFFLLPVTIARIALVVPIFFYWQYIHAHDAVLASDEHLPQKFASPIRSTEHFAALWSIVLFCWNAAILVPCLFTILPPFNLPVAVMDTLLAACVAKILNQQEAYIPPYEFRCHDLRGRDQPWSGDNGYFMYAAERAGSPNDEEHFCKLVSREWQYGVAIVYVLVTVYKFLSNKNASVFYFLIAFFEWLAFLIMASSFRYLVEPQRRNLVNVFKSVCLIPSLAVTIIKGILYDTHKWIYRTWCPTAAKRRVRAGRRLAVKAGMAVEQKTEAELRAWASRSRQRYIDTEPKDPVPPLARFLCNYDALVLLVQQLHYMDVLMLARTCKSVRDVVLPSHDFDRRLTVFSRYTCGESKECCWLCVNQVCEVRRPSFRQSFVDTDLSHQDCRQAVCVARQNLDWHLESCRPYCDDCFQHEVLRRHQTSALKFHPYCQCEPVPAKNLNELVWDGRQRFAKQPQWKLLCRACADIRPITIVDKRQERTRSELRRGINVHAGGKKWTKCGKLGCENELNTTGPRWWVCGNGTCRKECTSLVHDAWRRLKQGDVAAKAPSYPRWCSKISGSQQATRQEAI